MQVTNYSVEQYKALVQKLCSCNNRQRLRELFRRVKKIEKTLPPERLDALYNALFNAQERVQIITQNIK